MVILSMLRILIIKEINVGAASAEGLRSEDGIGAV
jgi:hypothetical protein